MAITCPACNKANQTEAACSRCGCSLSNLHEIVSIAGSRLTAAHAALAARDWPAALRHAEGSWRLCHSTGSARIAFLAAAASGETARALCWRARAATPSSHER